MIVLLVTFLASCAGQSQKTVPSDGGNNKTGKARRSEIINRAEKMKSTKNAVRNASLTGRERIVKLVGSSEYEEALNLIRIEKGSGKEDSYLNDLMVDSINGLEALGLKHFSEDEFETAGKIFKTAMDNIPADKSSVLEGIKLNRQEVDSYIDACADKLMEYGLFSYRKGNLGEAIDIWSRILMFNKGHREAIKAINTATVQMERLKVIESTK